ncbi:MAG: tyrosine-type recombinase/integrase [Desulfovibrionaceae bacterium]
MSSSVTKAVEKNIYKYIYARGYLVSVYVAGIRKTKRVNTIEEARIAREELKTDILISLDTSKNAAKGKKEKKQTTTTSSTCWTIGYAVDRTIEIHWVGTSGGVNAARNARQAARFFGERAKLDDIQMENIDEYIEYLRSTGNSGATINRKLSSLSKVMRTAYERGKLKRPLRMPRMKEALNRIRFLTVEEEVILLSTLENLGYHSQAEAVRILLYTGFRCSELWRLECRDIDLERCTITVWKTKNGTPRTVPIVAGILPLIREKYEQAGGTGRLFPMGTNDWLHNAWFRARTLMGMDSDPQFVPHMLRHTCATRLAQRGVSMPVIRQWMGHTTIITTSRYTHFAPSDLQGAARLLS